jgi:hypothetical protein
MAGDDVIAELVSERRALRKELGEADVRNVVQFYQRPLANFIHAQMEPHFWQKATAFDARVHQGFEAPPRQTRSGVSPFSSRMTGRACGPPEIPPLDPRARHAKTGGPP